MVKAVRGVLVKCDASIKSMLVQIDSQNKNDFIIEELDEEHLLVKETKINELKSRLNAVCLTPLHFFWLSQLTNCS